MARQNFSAALQMSMPQVIRQYIRSFDVQHRLQDAQNFLEATKFLTLDANSTPDGSAGRKKLQSWRSSGL